MSLAVLGIDIAKQKFDVALLLNHLLLTHFLILLKRSLPDS